MKQFAILFAIVMLLAITGCNQERNTANNSDPLPSWVEGKTKSGIIEFVEKISKEGSPNYVAPEERIATFDQDGTLWCEQPIVQLEYVTYKIKKMASSHPEWEQIQPYKSVLEDDKEYLINDLYHNHGKELLKLFLITHSGMTIEKFNADVKEFIETTKHSKFGKKYTETIYLPMLEVLQYLQKNKFKTYICSGGGNDFMRVFAEEVYGIVPENVMGSFAMNTFEQVDGSWAMVKSIDNFFKNDGLTKPAVIANRIGRTPIFVAGNVRSGGDIGQLTYSQTNTLPNFQLLVNHDDADREFAYSEKDNASLNAAKEGKWHVVSMKNDWLKIFPFH